uniref:Uncharacterized protein n=1 Tax=Kalanchoe fedtschenkoi TaxID=63787 RepID=A0A7N0TPW0_KALFE
MLHLFRLLTPPGTPLFPSLEMEGQKTYMSQFGTPKGRPTSLKSRLANPQIEVPKRNSLVPRQPASCPVSSSTGIRRPSSSGGAVSRPPTPTGRATLTSSRPATPTGRSTLTATSRTSRPSTPTSRANLSSNKPTMPVTSRSAGPTRSTTPLSRPVARSSTPTGRNSIPASKPAPRASTPTRRPSPSPSINNTSASLSRSSSFLTKSVNSATSLTRSSGTTPTKTPVPSSVRSVTSAPKSSTPARAPSPTVKSRPWKPSEMPGFSMDAPPNLRTSAPERPLSASRGRPLASGRSSSVEPGSAGRPKRQSCSPSRGRLANGSLHLSGSSVPAPRRTPKVTDSVNPILMGARMVERVVNMRKLAPPQDDKHSPSLSGKSASSPDSSGFGRTLSKKSLDMAIRHMDIRRSIPGNLRPLMTNIPASSMYSVRSGSGGGPPTRGRTMSVSDSPLATSSNASSELSVNNNGLTLDICEIELDDNGSERGVRTPSSICGR